MRALGYLLAALLVLALPAAAYAERAGSLQKAFPQLDLSRATIKLKELRTGGVPRDGIPAIARPNFLPASQISDLGAEEPVIFLSGTCGTFAFPYRVLIWHEIVHHDHCGTPVAVTFCPLCNTSMVFDRTVEGTVLSFGTSGRLRNSDLVMYDHQTETLWQQFTGEAIVGTHVGQTLATVPARILSWQKFRELHPDGQVLVPPSWGEVNYGSNPYRGYDSAPSPMMYRGRMPRGIRPMTRVVRVGDRAWSLKHLRKNAPVTTDDGLSIEWSEGQNSVLDKEKISRGRDIGNVHVTRNGMTIAYSIDFAFAYRAFYPDGVLTK